MNLYSLEKQIKTLEKRIAILEKKCGIVPVISSSEVEKGMTRLK